MSRTTFEELLEAGVHFGHLKRKWNPNAAPYIFAEKKGKNVSYDAYAVNYVSVNQTRYRVVESKSN